MTHPAQPSAVRTDIVERAHLRKKLRERGIHIQALQTERNALRNTLRDLAAHDPLAAHAEADHALAYENNKRLVAFQEEVAHLTEQVRELCSSNRLLTEVAEAARKIEPPRMPLPGSMFGVEGTVYVCRYCGNAFVPDRRVEHMKGCTWVLVQKALAALAPVSEAAASTPSERAEEEPS